MNEEDQEVSTIVYQEYCDGEYFELRQYDGDDDLIGKVLMTRNCALQCAVVICETLHNYNDEEPQKMKNKLKLWHMKAISMVCLVLSVALVTYHIGWVEALSIGLMIASQRLYELTEMMEGLEKHDKET